MTTIEIIFPKWIMKLKAKVPTEWNELSAKQLISVAGLLYSGTEDLYKFRIELLRILIGLKWHHLLSIGSERLIDLYPFVQFIESEIRLTQNKIQYLKLQGKRYFGPIGDFSTLTGEEWTEADECFIEFHSSGDVAELDKMMAILFRERIKGISPKSENWANDYREPFSEARVTNRIPVMAKVPLTVKMAVLLWWKGCRREWEEVFERVFKSKGEGPQSFGWQETLLKLSGSEFGDLKSTQATPMYKLMLKMEVALKDEEYRKEQEDARKRSHVY